MKISIKLSFFIFIIIFIAIFSYPPKIFCSQDFVYARITQNQTYLYSSPSTEEFNKLFCLPTTYFVLLTGDCENENFYCATYMGISGYVQKSQVTPVVGSPITPYANSYSFRIFIPSGVELRSSPSSTNPFNILTSIPYLSTNQIFIGTLNGDEQISQKGNLWYYCKYVDGANQYVGYVYSAFCDLLAPIVDNTENLEVMTTSPFAPIVIETQTQTQNQGFLESNLKIIIIIAICLPFLFVIYLLFKPTKLVIDNGKSKKKIHRLKKSEFYEFDN